MDLNKLPDELVQNRGVIECNFVLSFYKNPDLILDYPKITNGEDIITPDGMFYFGLAKNLISAGYKTFDNMSIYEYLSDKKVLRDGFEKRGGYQTVQEITSLLSLDNIDTYYDELIKNNALIRLHGFGFDVVSNLDKFKNMSSEDVFDYYEYVLSNIAVGRIEKLREENLSSGYEKYIDDWDEGNDVGFPIASKMLNYQMLGVHRKNLLIHLAGIGQGKTTTAICQYVIPAIENGNDVCIIANEQDTSDWRQMILASVLFNKVGCNVKGFNRHKMKIGGFTEEQKQKMLEAAHWIEEQEGKIHFYEMPDYDVVKIKRVITRLSKIGVGLFLVDTLKPIDDSSERSWGEFSEIAKELFILAKNLNVAVIATAQLSSDAMSRKYLDLTCVGKSRAIAETASNVVMFRHLTAEEKKNVKPWNYRKDTKVKELITLDPDKDYIMVFVPKNRYGPVNPQIIMEMNMSFNTMKDVGRYECEFDQFRTR